MSRRWKIFAIVGLISLIADQATKIWARGSLPTRPGGPFGHYGISEIVIENFWEWRLSYNPGSAFGLFNETAGARIFLTVIGLVALGFIVLMLHRSRENQTRLAWALGLVAGGAVGNLYDRIASGVVTDFVVWKYYDAEWPTFNIADVTLVVGVGLLFLDMITEGRTEAALAAEKDQTSATDGSAKKGEAKKSRR